MSDSIQVQIKEAREHAESLRLAMQDQAAETIESLCDALETVAATAVTSGTPRDSDKAGPLYRVFCEALTPNGLVTGYLQAVSSEIEPMETTKELATLAALKATNQVLSHLCLVSFARNNAPKITVLPEKVLERSTLTFLPLPLHSVTPS